MKLIITMSLVIFSLLGLNCTSSLKLAPPSMGFKKVGSKIVDWRGNEVRNLHRKEITRISDGFPVEGEFVGSVVTIDDRDISLSLNIIIDHSTKKISGN